MSAIDKRMNLEEVVAELRDGMTIGIGGWGPRRKPMAMVRAILRSDLKDLTVVTYGGADVGMLAAAGRIRKLVFAFVSLDAIPLEPWFRRVRESGELEVLELDEGMFQWGLKAAAYGLPFLPTRVGLGTDLAALSDLKTVTSPYEDCETLIAMPALPLDVALLHFNRCDWRGNIQALGPDTYYDEWFARAAKRSFVSAEVVVEAIEESYPEDARANIVSRSFVSGVVHAPCGAHPSSMPPAYGWDMVYLKRYAAAAREEGGWAAFVEEATGRDEADYIARVGGAEAVAALPLPTF